MSPAVVMIYLRQACKKEIKSHEVTTDKDDKGQVNRDKGNRLGS